MASLAEWQITETGWVQLALDRDRAGNAMMTLGVDDLEMQVSELKRRGLPTGTITSGEAARFASMSDPDGNAITFAVLMNA
jgi:hypothetical protein